MPRRAPQQTPRDRAHDAVRTELGEEVRLLAEGMRWGAGTGWVATLLLVAVLDGLAGETRTVAWIAASTLVHGIAAALAHRVVSGSDRPAERDRRHLVLAAATGGALWGAAGWILLPVASFEHVALFVTFLAITWTGAVTTLGASVPATAAFLLLGGLPTVLGLLVGDGRLHALELALALTALAATTVAGTLRFRRGLGQWIRSRVRAGERERELVEQERRLAESEEKYRSLFERSEDPMWLIVGARFMLANAAAARFLEYDDPDAITDLHPSQLSPAIQPCGTPSDELAERRMSTAYRQGYHRFEWIHATRTGREIPVEVTLTRVPYQGEPALFCVWRDVSERHRHQRELEEARVLAEQASVAKSTFLSTMSHEIRTPLSAVLGMSELLEDTGLDDEQREFVRTISSAGRNLLSVVNDVLDLSKIEAGRMEIRPRPTDLAALLEDLERIFRPRVEGLGLELRVQIEAGCPRHLSLDDARLTQILVNLCGNACKFTERGRIEVLASAVTASAGDQRLRIAVRDTGIGIAPAARERLFEPFRQAEDDTSRQYGGTGLGLSICSRLAELMRGSIGVESTPGEGSTFTVDLPLVREEPPAPVSAEADQRIDPPRTAPEPPAETATGLAPLVLVVDDVEVNRRLTTAMLTSLGLRTCVAADGEEALAVHAERAPDLVLMDCQMPVMDGYEATGRLRVRERGAGVRTPIVALTAAALSEDRERCRAAGMDDFLAKPFRKAELRAVVERNLPTADTSSEPVAVDPARS